MEVQPQWHRAVRATCTGKEGGEAVRPCTREGAIVECGCSVDVGCWAQMSLVLAGVRLSTGSKQGTKRWLAATPKLHSSAPKQAATSARSADGAAHSGNVGQAAGSPG